MRFIIMKRIISVLYCITVFVEIFAGQLGDGTNKYQKTPVRDIGGI